MYTWPVESKCRVDFNQEDLEYAVLAYLKSIRNVPSDSVLVVDFTGDPAKETLEAHIKWTEKEEH